MVPAPSGILAVGDNMVGDLVEFDLAGELLPELILLAAKGERGETGFILRPLMAGFVGKADAAV